MLLTVAGIAAEIFKWGGRRADKCRYDYSECK